MLRATAAATATATRTASNARAALSKLRPYSTNEQEPATDHDIISHADADAHPDTKSILETQEKYLLGTYSRVPLVFTRGRGSHLYDSGGREFLDFSAGIAVNALGHADAGVAEVLADQAGKLVHTSNLFHHKPAGDLARRLIESTGGGEGSVVLDGTREGREGGGGGGLFKADKVFFGNSGTEANEGALKFVRKYAKVVAREKYEGRPKFEVVCFANAFHGRSMGALSATYKHAYRAPYEPLVPGFSHVPFNDVKAAVEAIHEGTCAVIIEPIQGEGGVFAATNEFLAAIRKKCDEVGALLIFDEIQCGIGRTGKLWAFENFPANAQPDIVTIAKPLANGVPIGAVLLNAKSAAIVSIGDHGTTFGGNPLSCRVADHVFRRISDPSFLSRVDGVGEALRKYLRRELAPRPTVADVRGLGLMIGVQMTVDPTPLVRYARERGLIIITAANQTVRIVPPLVLTTAEAEEGARIFARAVKAYEEELKKDGE